MFPATRVSYCGLPPVPGSTAWNFDPILLVCLAACALAYFVPRRRVDNRVGREVFAFTVGLAALSLAFISPLCNLSVALFSARITQHMIIMLVAAPLLVFGKADFLALPGGKMILNSGPTGRERMLAPAVFAAVLWFWHTPMPYDATLRNAYVYWAMHITLIAASILLWRSLLRGLAKNPAPPILASFFVNLQMIALGALLTFAPRVLFTAHLNTASAWGLTALQDQQLGGLIMWVPGGCILAAHALFAFSFFFSRRDAQSLDGTWQASSPWRRRTAQAEYSRTVGRGRAY
jgi:putative membrane protein